MAERFSTAAIATGCGVILASQSPRRAQLLDQLGVAYRVVVADIDESLHPEESAEAYVSRLALAKAQTVLDDHPSEWVLGCDTTVLAPRNNQVLGKPRDVAEARAMLQALSSPNEPVMHRVYSGVALISASHVLSAVEVTTVTLAPLDEARIDAYIATGEPFGKAGAYAIQGKAAAFVKGVEGCFSNVVGLPLKRTCDLLTTAGIPVWRA